MSRKHDVVKSTGRSSSSTFPKGLAALCAAAVVALASGSASARTMAMTKNVAAGVTTFDFTFDNVGSGTTNSLWMVCGAVDGGNTSFSSWSNVRHVADIPGDVTTLTDIPAPSGWGASVTQLRFFLADAGIVPCADQLDFIRSNQTGGNYQYIATSYVPNGDTVFETEIALTQPTGGNNQTIFCARASYQNTSIVVFWLSSSQWRLDYNNQANTATYTSSPGTDRHLLMVDSSGITVDGSLLAGTSPTAASFTAGGPMSLFASQTGEGSNLNNWGLFALYSFKAWNTHTGYNAGGKPAIDLVPCSKNGVACLYDRVGDVFLMNAGAGAFTAGNVVVSAASVDAPLVATELVSAGSSGMVYWTGNGGADTRVSNPANWGAADNETLPDLDSGTVDAMFATGGSALLDRSAAFNGLSFASSSAFTFSDSSETLTVSAGGISTEPDATPTVKHTINAPVRLAMSQTWFANTNATFEFTKPLSFISASDTLTLSGAGKWSFHATSTFPNDVFATGDGMTLNGQARVNVYADNALGGPDGTFVMNITHGALQFYGVTNSRPVVTYCTKSDHDPGLYLIGDAGATNVFDATYANTNANLHLYIGRGTTFIANKTFTTRSACYAAPTGSGSADAHWIMNAKLHVGDRFNLPSGMILDLNVPTNRINGNRGSIGGRINLNVPYALSFENGNGQGTQFTPNHGTLDLHGNDNALGIIYTFRATDAGTITSETPATMHLVDNYMMPPYDSGQKDAAGNQIQAFGYTNRVEFTGCASFSKEGKYTNRLMRVSSTYGDLTVTKGRLEMDQGATWANASNLVVKGTGLFTLEDHPADAPAFGKQLVVHVEPGYDANGQNPKARIELLNTTPQPCAELYVDGVRQSAGYWGSAAAAAANPGLNVCTSSFFSGTGLLRVSGRKLYIIVR